MSADARLDVLEDLFFEFDETGAFVDWNRSVPEVTGDTDAELAEMTPAAFFEGADATRVADAVTAVFEGGEGVTVRVGALPDGLFLEADGPGIPPEDREDVFDRGHSGTAGGTGLGLAIVREVAEAHGWSVRATGGTEGGARFEFGGVTEPADT